VSLSSISPTIRDELGELQQDSKSFAPPNCTYGYEKMWDIFASAAGYKKSQYNRILFHRNPG
jgi:hypothetical protein